MNRLSLIVGTVCVAAVAIAAVQDAVNLRRTPTQGETLRYALKAEVDFQGEKVQFTAETSEKVTEVRADGSYVVESGQKNGKALVAGSEMPVPDQVSTMTMSADGRVLEMKGDQVDGDAYRLAYLSAFVVSNPTIAVGTKWSHETPADAQRGTVAVKADYEYAGNETVDGIETARVTFTSAETGGSAPASATGTMWLNRTNGSLVKLEQSIKNAPLMGMVLDAKITLTLVR